MAIATTPPWDTLWPKINSTRQNGSETTARPRDLNHHILNPVDHNYDNPSTHPNKSALPNGLKRAPNAHNTADCQGARLFPALESTLNDYMRGGSAIEG